MTINAAMILWFFLWAFVVSQLVPKPAGWGKLAVWGCIVLLSVVLILLHALVLH